MLFKDCENQFNTQCFFSSVIYDKQIFTNQQEIDHIKDSGIIVHFKQKES